MAMVPSGRTFPSVCPAIMKSNMWMLAVVLSCVLLGPVCSALPIEYTIEEELAPDRVIGNLVTDANLERNYSSILNTLRYGILPGKFQKYFAVDTTRGLLKIGSVIDRDELCTQQEECILSLEAAVTQPELQIFGVIAIKVTILDKNDNQPRFSKSTIIISISESANLESRYMLPTAFDPDSGVNGIQDYNLYSGYGQFRLEESDSVGSDTDIHLVLQGQLDREKQNSYTLQLLATDGGTPSKTGTLAIDVQIVDANDNSPVFDQTALYNISVKEDEELNKILLRVHASDHDKGQNGEVIYYFNGQTADLFGHQFGVDNKTGDIFLKIPLDYQTSKQYQLVVTAQDLGPDALKAHAKVFIHVQDTNNHAPVITVSPVISGGDISVMENQAAGAIVGIVSVEDPDQGINGDCTCQIRDQNFILRKLYENGYKIVTRQKFNREDQESYSVLIGCQDGGSPQLRSSQQISIAILDTNDNAPIFTRRLYSVSIKENSPPGLPMLRVNATDLDHGQNAKVTYTLSSAAKGLATIDADTGVIFNALSYDYEKTPQLNFLVLAEDSGEVPRSATATVSIIVVDVNDEAPKFNQPFYNFGSYENQDVGTEIGTVIAEDKDSEAFSNFTFSLVAEYNVMGTFKINSTTGKITTKKILDREATSAYYLTVMATDVTPPRLSSSTTVTIYVADKNDNAPTITFPNPYNRTVQVSEYAPPNYVFATVEVHDVDLGDNARLSFSLNDGDYITDYFGINPVTGEIHVRQKLKKLNKDRVQLQVLVEDFGTPPLSAFATLHVVINKTLEYAHSKLLVSTTGPLAPLGHHVQIIVILAAVTAVLVVILVAAIILVKRRQMRHAKESHKHIQRVDFSNRMSAQGMACPAHDASFEAASVISDSSSDKTKVIGLQFGMDNKLLYGNGNMEPRIIPNPQVTRGSLKRIPEDEASSRPGSLSILDPLSQVNNVPGDSRRGQSPMRSTATRSSVLGNRPLQGRSAELQQNRLSHSERDSDTTSGCSADVSNTDSGHGPSEEGDNHDNTANLQQNPPAVPPRTGTGATNSNRSSLSQDFSNSKDCPVHGQPNSRLSSYEPLRTSSKRFNHADPDPQSRSLLPPANHSIAGSHGTANCGIPVPTKFKFGGRHNIPLSTFSKPAPKSDNQLIYTQPQVQVTVPESSKTILPHLDNGSLTHWADSQTQDDSDHDDMSSTSGSFIVNISEDPISSVNV